MNVSTSAGWHIFVSPGQEIVKGRGPVGPQPQDGTLLVPRRPAHRLPAPARAVLVKDLLGGQQSPKALYTLPEGHVHLLLKSRVQNHEQSICARHIVVCE
jgi:hypothetical protein